MAAPPIRGRGANLGAGVKIGDEVWQGDVPVQARDGRREATGDEQWITVVIDPGHGGHDTGAIGPSGLMEKDVVLDLGLRLKRLLEQRLRVRVLSSARPLSPLNCPSPVRFAGRSWWQRCG